MKLFPVYEIKTSGSNDCMCSMTVRVAASNINAARKIYDDGDNPGTVRRAYGSIVSIEKVEGMYSKKEGML